MEALNILSYHTCHVDIDNRRQQPSVLIFYCHRLQESCDAFYHNKFLHDKS